MSEKQEYDVLRKRLNALFHSEIKLYQIKEGSQSNSYIVEAGSKKYFLKIGISQIDGSGVNNEFLALRFLKKNCGAHIPQVKSFFTLYKRKVLITNFIRHQAIPIAPALLGKIFYKIHSHQNYLGSNYLIFSSELFKKLNNKIANMSYVLKLKNKVHNLIALQKITLSLSRIERLILQDARWKKTYYPSFINMDNNDNIMIQQNIIYVTDWHLARYGDPAWDIARLFSYYNFSREKFLKAYLKNTIVQSYFFLERLRIYMAFNNVLNIFYYHLMQKPDIVNYKINPMIEKTRIEEKCLSKIIEHKILIKLNQINNELLKVVRSKSLLPKKLH